jgi:hypothetical protein
MKQPRPTNEIQDPAIKFIKLHYEAARIFGPNIKLNKPAQLEHEKDILERFKSELYTLEVAAVEMAEKTGWDADRWLSAIKQAIKRGELPLKNPMDYTDKLPYDVPDKLCNYSDLVSAVDFNAWLAAHPEWGVTARLGYETIDNLNLSIRTSNCLKAAKIYLINELITYSNNELFKIPLLGRKSLEEIHEELARRGLKLSDG